MSGEKQLINEFINTLDFLLFVTGAYDMEQLIFGHYCLCLHF